MSRTIPIGPYHPALEEPYKLDLVCHGERIEDVRIKVGFNFRGIEHLAQQRTWLQNIALVERVCGICSNVHTLTFCQGVERLMGIHAPERAQYIRVIVAELERLHSHILWAGIAAEVMGFQTVFMVCFRLRETIMDLLEQISGNRVNYAMNCVGGVNRDIADLDALLLGLKTVEEEVQRTIIPLFTQNATIRARCSGIGVLSLEDARAWGVVGPTGRASGLTQDIRKAAPYSLYDRFTFAVPTQTSGDVYARIVVRALEILESISIIRQAAAQMPQGAWQGVGFFQVPAGMTTFRIEGPRGEVFYFLESDGSDIPRRVRIRTPSFMGMPTVRLMLHNMTLADAPLVQASIDPCYSCTDR